MPRLVIIGAGWAGLAAATTAVDYGLDVMLFERSNDIGGRASSFWDKNFGQWLDNGPHVFIGAYTTALSLMRIWDCGDCVDFRTGSTIPWIFDDGVLKRLKIGNSRFTSAMNLLFFRGMSLRDRITVLKGMKVLLNTPLQDPESEETVSDFFSRQGMLSGGSGLFWEALTTAVMNGSIRESGVYPLARALRAGLEARGTAARIGILQKPLRQLYCEPAARYLESKGVALQTGRVVREIRPDFRNGTITVDSNEQATRADAVIIAVPPVDLALMLPLDVLDLPFFNRLHEFEYSAITAVHYQFDKPILQVPFAMFPEGFAHWVFGRGERDKDGWAGISALISRSPTGNAESTDETRSGIENDLRKRLPRIENSTIINTRVVRTAKATVLLRPGSDLLRPDIETPLKGLYLAGDWVNTGLPATIESAARSGVIAANKVVQYFTNLHL